MPGGIGLPRQQTGRLLLRLSHRYLRQERTGGGHCLGQPRLLPGPLGAKSDGICLKSQSAADHLFPGLRLCLSDYRNIDAKAVQQLRPKDPLLRIHGSYQRKSGGTGMGNAVPLHPAHPALQGVQQGTAQSGGKQIDLIGVQHCPVGPSQQTGLELPPASAHRRLQLHAAQKHVLRGAHRELHQVYALQPTHGPHQGGLSRPFFSAQQYAPDAGLHGQAEKRLLCPLLTHHGGEGISGSIHGTVPPS